MKRVLVTGSSGEIGSALVRALRRQPEVDFVAGCDLNDLRPNGPVLLARNIAALTAQTLRQHRIDTVIHAAYTVQPAHNPSEARRTANDGMRALLRATHAAAVSRFVHLSSATVYGAHPGNPAALRESAPLRPNTGFPYAEDKAAAEAVLAEFPMLPVQVVLRPSFVIGPGTTNPLMRHLCRWVALLPGTESPMQFVHRDDLVRVVIALAGHGISGIFNVGAPGGLLPTAMARALGNCAVPLPDGLLDRLNYAGWHARLPWAPAPTAALELLRFPWRVDCAALRGVLLVRGVNPFPHTSQDAFADFAQHYHACRTRRDPGSHNQGRNGGAKEP